MLLLPQSPSRGSLGGSEKNLLGHPFPKVYTHTEHQVMITFIHAYISISAYYVSTTVTGPRDEKLTKQRLPFWDLTYKERSSSTKYY